MKLGVFDHMDRGVQSLDRFYEERLKLVEAYDRAGFYGYHVAEHHATPLGVAPSPGVWLAAVAGVLAILAFSGKLTGGMVLLGAFGLGIGFALNAPIWAALLTDLVPRERLASAFGPANPSKVSSA